jgi:hypothetical protein
MMLSFSACRKQAESAATATSGNATQVAATQSLTPEQLGELGAQIKKDPARADELLAQRHLTRESFEKAIRDVTEDADASKRYAASYRKAGG